MTNANDPINHHLTYNQISCHANGEIEGLTKREYFAAMAMQGIVSNRGMIDTDNWEWLAENSVKAADALITALNQTK